MFQKKKNEKKKKFVPIYSFFSSNSDGLCLIFTSVYINYASHYGREDGRLFTARGGGTRKRAAMNVRSAGSRRSKSEKRSAQGEEEHKKQSGPIYER